MSKEVVDIQISKIYESSSTGEVQIADDVVATIAGLAATEVEGVYAMYGNLTNEIVGKLGVITLGKTSFNCFFQYCMFLELRQKPCIKTTKVLLNSIILRTFL